MATTGPATEFIEAIATSIGAGMLLGGFAASLLAAVLGTEPERRDEALIAWSSFAGLVTAAVVALEAILG